MANIAETPNDNYAVAMSTSAAEIVTRGGPGDAGNPRQVTLHNADASLVIYVGFGEDVSSANGMPIPAGGYKQFLLHHYDEMHGISASGTPSLRVAIVHGKGNPA
jgi:hypothetical protein